jgi:hypothetical protein
VKRLLLSARAPSPHVKFEQRPGGWADSSVMCMEILFDLILDDLAGFIFEILFELVVCAEQAQRTSRAAAHLLNLLPLRQHSGRDFQAPT